MPDIYDPDLTLPADVVETTLSNASKTITFDDDGNARFIYDDEVAGLLKDLGPMDIRRASHVEPYGTGWTADMSPVGGGLYGPFATRKHALAFEVAWLKENRGL